MDDFIERIKRVRLSNKLIQQKFAEAIGSSQGNVADWERGRSLPSASAIRKIVNTFDVDPAWLMNGSYSSTETVLPLPFPLEDDEKKEITHYARWLVSRRDAFQKPTNLSPTASAAKSELHSPPHNEKADTTLMVPVFSNPKAAEPTAFEHLLKGFAPIKTSYLQGTCLLLLIDEDQQLHTGMRRNDLALIQLHARLQPGDLAALRLHHQIVFAYYPQPGHSMTYQLLNAPESPGIPFQTASLVGRVLHIIKREEAGLTYQLSPFL